MSEESAIRAVQKVENVYLEDHLKIEVILDSGADVSLLPLHLATEQGTILTDGESMIPVHFPKNSLATYAFIP